MPLGTAHETPTPSFSSRKSQCNRRAWCSWTTNRGALVSLRGTLAPGSGVRLKSRLASYAASFFAMTKRLGHGSLLIVDGELRTPLRAHDKRRAGGHEQDGDGKHQRRVHGVHERVREDGMGDGLHLRRELKACARLPGAHLEAGPRGMAEALDEVGAVSLRQLARRGHRLVVEREREAILEERTDDR